MGIAAQRIVWFLRQPLIGPMLAHPLLHRALLAGCLLQVGVSWFGQSLIECPVPRLFGIDCPGCGLTRAVIAVLHGDLGDASRIHIFAFPALFVCGLFLLASGMRDASRRRFASRVEDFERSSCISSLSIIAIHLYWLARLV